MVRVMGWFAGGPSALPALISVAKSCAASPFADANGGALIVGHDELYPLFLAAAHDFAQPLFAYGPPRTLRLGIELVF